MRAAGDADRLGNKGRGEVTHGATTTRTSRNREMSGDSLGAGVSAYRGARLCGPKPGGSGAIVRGAGRVPGVVEAYANTRGRGRADDAQIRSQRSHDLRRPEKTRARATPPKNRPSLLRATDRPARSTCRASGERAIDGHVLRRHCDGRGGK